MHEVKPETSDDTMSFVCVQSRRRWWWLRWW